MLAVEDCLLATLTPAAFKELLALDSEIAARVMQKLVRIIRSADDRGAASADDLGIGP